MNHGEHPFLSHHIAFPLEKMHYVDDGEGEPLLRVQGNPTWFFLYQYMIKNLSDRFRRITMDHIGFGLSDKPIN